MSRTQEDTRQPSDEPHYESSRCGREVVRRIDAEYVQIQQQVLRCLSRKDAEIRYDTLLVLTLTRYVLYECR